MGKFDRWTKRVDCLNHGLSRIVTDFADTRPECVGNPKIYSNSFSSHVKMVLKLTIFIQTYGHQLLNPEIPYKADLKS